MYGTVENTSILHSYKYQYFTFLQEAKNNFYFGFSHLSLIWVLLLGQPCIRWHSYLYVQVYLIWQTGLESWQGWVPAIPIEHIWREQSSQGLWSRRSYKFILNYLWYFVVALRPDGVFRGRCLPARWCTAQSKKATDVSPRSFTVL